MSNWQTGNKAWGYGHDAERGHAQLDPPPFSIATRRRDNSDPGLG
jgi:hypothetical protein